MLVFSISCSVCYSFMFRCLKCLCGVLYRFMVLLRFL